MGLTRALESNMELPAWSLTRSRTVIGLQNVSAGSFTCTTRMSWISQLRCRCASMDRMALAPSGSGYGGHLGASQTATPLEPQCSTVKEAHELGMQARTCTGNDAWARTGFKSKLIPE